MANLKQVETKNAPAAIGPYAQAQIAGNLVFTAGQIPLDPASMELISGGIAEQTERVMLNVAAVLEAAGSSTDKLVKCGIFLADFDDFQAMNEVYARHVGSSPPARATVQVAYLPSGVLVEIDAIAHL